MPQLRLGADRGAELLRQLRAEVVFRSSPAAQIYGAYGNFLLWAVYFGFAASQFWTGRRASGWVKGVVAVILAQAAVSAAVSLIALLLRQ